MEYGVVALAAYLIGAIPTGFLMGRLLRNVDVRSYGSGRIGATNVLRTLGLGPFILVFLIDFAKGYLPVWLAGQWLGMPAQVTAGLGALVGHNWPVYIGFTGGRGVATGMGGLSALAPQVAALVAIAVVLVMLTTRYVSLGSVVGCVFASALSIGAVALGLEHPALLLYVLPGATIVFYQHRDNIRRLMAGTERKLGEAAEPR